jgi:hypothetical protein
MHFDGTSIKITTYNLHFNGSVRSLVSLVFWVYSVVYLEMSTAQTLQLTSLMFSGATPANPR